MLIPTEKGYPSKWSDWVKVDAPPEFCAGLFEFRGKMGDVYRFGARFRAANCFQGVKLEGYSDSTEDGYSALLHVTLVWSAFETLLEIKGKKHVADAQNNLAAHGADEVLQQIKGIDSENIFYKFIYDRVNSSHKRQLDSYFNQDPCNIGYLASSIRHIFAHGWLTPNAAGVDPAKVVEICQLLCKFMLTFMDEEFTRHAKQYQLWTERRYS